MIFFVLQVCFQYFLAVMTPVQESLWKMDQAADDKHQSRFRTFWEIKRCEGTWKAEQSHLRTHGERMIIITERDIRESNMRQLEFKLKCQGECKMTANEHKAQAANRLQKEPQELIWCNKKSPSWGVWEAESLCIQYIYLCRKINLEFWLKLTLCCLFPAGNWKRHKQGRGCSVVILNFSTLQSNTVSECQDLFHLLLSELFN